MRCRIWVLLLLGASLCGCGREAPESIPEAEHPPCPSFVSADAGLPVDGEWRTHPSLADIDGDGLDDLAALSRKGEGPNVFLSDGLGQWSDASAGLEYEGGFSCGVGTRLHDLDQDGYLDLLVADHCKGLFVYRGNGGTSWTEDSRGIPRNMEGFNDAEAGDLDGDGILDIVAVSAFTRGFLVLYGKSDGSYRIGKETDLPPTGSGWQVFLSDVNADGHLDIVTSFNPTTTNFRVPTPSPAKVWLQDAAGRFRPAEGFKPEGRYFGLALVPRTESPIPDLLLGVFGFHAGLHLYRSETGEQWTQIARVDQEWFGDRPRGFSGVVVDDVNADGCPDVLANEGSSRHVLVGVGDCAGNWHLCPEQTLPSSANRSAGWGLTTGDINGDGRRDVVSGQGTHAGNLRAWYQVDPATAEAVAAQGQGPAVSRTARAPAESTP